MRSLVWEAGLRVQLLRIALWSRLEPNCINAVPTQLQDTNVASRPVDAWEDALSQVFRFLFQVRAQVAAPVLPAQACILPGTLTQIEHSYRWAYAATGAPHLDVETRL